MNVQIKLQTNEKRWFEVRELSITPKLPVLLLYFVYPRDFEIYFSQHKTESARQTDKGLRPHLFTYVVAEPQSEKQGGCSIYPFHSSDLDKNNTVRFIFSMRV